MPVYYDADGNKQVNDVGIDAYVPDLLAIGSPIDAHKLGFDVLSVQKKVGAVGGRMVLALRSVDINESYTVLDSTLLHNVHYYIRLAVCRRSIDQQYVAGMRSRVEREVEMMKWMSAIGVPVPEVIHVALYDVGVPPMFIHEKRRGTILLGAFGGLSEEAKIANLRSYAEIALKMFDAPCPQGGIGAIQSFTPSSLSTQPPPWSSPHPNLPAQPYEPATVQLGPSIELLAQTGSTPPTPFPSIQSYFAWLISTRRRPGSLGLGKSEDEIAGALRTLDRLEVLITRCCERLQRDLAVGVDVGLALRVGSAPLPSELESETDGETETETEIDDWDIDANDVNGTSTTSPTTLSSLLLDRTAPTHGNLTSRNVLITSTFPSPTHHTPHSSSPPLTSATSQPGRIRCLYGWERHAVLPRIMCAAYPAWIDYGGVRDPRFAWRGEEEEGGVKAGSGGGAARHQRVWDEGPEEASRLRRVYEEIIKHHPVYHLALTSRAGATLREAREWLLDEKEDRGHIRLAAWMEDREKEIVV